MPRLVVVRKDAGPVDLDDKDRWRGQPVNFSGAPHGMCSTREGEVNADLFAFLRA